MELPRELSAILNQVVDVLKARYQPDQIVLFGSWAYGTPTAESDMDLLIVKRTDQPFHRRWADVYELVHSLVRGIDFSPIVLTPDEIAQRQQARDPFVEDVLSRGRTLYRHAA